MKLKKIGFELYKAEAGKENEKIAIGEWVDAVKTQKDRSTPEHRKLFGIAKTVLMNMKNNDIVKAKHIEGFIKFSMLELNYCETYKLDGKIQKIPFSINFQNMKHDVFHEMFGELIGLWAMILKCDPKELTDSTGNID